MATLTPVTPESQQASRPPPAPRARLALALAVVCTLPFLLGVVLPYYVAGLQHRPEGESLYVHDLSGVWPYDTALGGPVATFAFFGMPLAPFVAACVLAWSCHALWSGRHLSTRREVALLVAAAATALGTLGWLMTPLAGELFVWFVD